MNWKKATYANFNPQPKTFSKKKAAKKKADNLPVLIQLADALVRSTLINTYSVNGIAECFTCGIKMQAKFLEVGHFVKRQHKAVRWNLKNCHLQCFYCNRDYGNVVVYADKINKKYGAGTAESLIAESKKPFKLDRTHINQIIESLRK